MSKQGQKPSEPSTWGKRPYQRPQVKDYGSVAHLTAGGSQGAFPDGQGAMVMVEMP